MISAAVRPRSVERFMYRGQKAAMERPLCIILLLL